MRTTVVAMQVHVSNSNGCEIESENELKNLWQEIRKGNEDALDTLFCLTYSRLFNYGFQITPQKGLVKDAIQELFLRLWGSHTELSEAYSVKSYLFHSLRRILLRNLKTQRNRFKRNKKYVDDFFEEMYNIEELMIHFETEQKQKEKLIEALESLSKRQKEAVFLKFYEGASNDEIANIMEISSQSVYNLIYRSIEKLKTFVK